MQHDCRLSVLRIEDDGTVSSPPSLPDMALIVVSGRSRRLRDEQVESLLGAWTGPVHRVTAAERPDRIILDVDTPSFFAEPALWVVRADQAHLQQHAAAWLALARPTQPGQGRVLMALGSAATGGAGGGGGRARRGGKAGSGDALAQLTQTLQAAEAWIAVEEPQGRSVVDWLIQRLRLHPQGADRPRLVAEAMLQHSGEDVDRLLCDLDLALVAAGEGPVTPELIHTILGGIAERPVWECTAAVLDGRPDRALQLLHAGHGLEPQMVLSALATEIRKLLACCASEDDPQVAAWLGGRGPTNFYYARQRARQLGAGLLQRLANGCMGVQRSIRHGQDASLALELLVLHAHRILQPAGR
jgi:DNA polymerase III delta subunit